MTHVKELRLRNWRCFQGEQLLELRPLTYAVVAQAANNPDRSNWLGKSSLLEAIRFALTGQLQKGEGVEEWITRGEAEGGVDVELSDGTYVSRGRERGGRTTLLYVNADGVELQGDNAARAMAHYFEPELFDLSFYLGQDATSRLITMGSTERSTTVMGWLGLDRVEEAHADVAEQLKLVANRVQVLEQLLAAPVSLQHLADADQAAHHAAQTYAEAKAAYEGAVAMDQAYRNWRAEQVQQDRARQIRQSIGVLEREQLLYQNDPPTSQAREVSQQRSVERTELYREAGRLKVLARGEFDGVCPVDGGIGPCPKRADINRRSSVAAEQLRRVNEQYSAKDAEAVAAERALETQQKREHRARSIVQELSSLHAELERIPAPIHQNAKPVDTTPLLHAMNDAARAQGAANQACKTLEAQRTNQLELDRELKAKRQHANELRAATLVLGRGGVQRTMAESGLGAIRQHANGALATADVPLQLAITWATEGKLLDPNCQACGHYYGKGQAEKTCPGCQTPRARVMRFDLAVDLSDVSGGARDLAGLVLQLSAARWLRVKRRWDWATYLVDEPFGAVDRANRVALAARLHGMMEHDFGAEQALVVAHDVDTLESLPARIQITSRDGRSRVEVHHG